MRQAVAKLGKDAPLADLIKFIKQTFNMTIDRALAYNYKSLVSSQVAGKRRGRKPGRKPKAVATAAARNGRRAVAITLDDVQAVKALADRLGAEKVAQLAAVLAK